MNNDILKNILKVAEYPRTPIEKTLELLKFIKDRSRFDGDAVIINNAELLSEFLANRLFFRNSQEFEFYMSIIKEKGFVVSHYSHNEISLIHDELFLTIDGLSFLIENGKNETTTKNNSCFVAMSFDDEERPIREAIRDAIKNCEHNPIFVDEIHVNSDKTVNDAIISELRKAKFCIADFTRQRNGVYFESGFALGLGIKVIYSCHKKWFKESHFDTNHFSHIIYDDPSDLTKSLEDKIRAWIN